MKNISVIVPCYNEKVSVLANTLSRLQSTFSKLKTLKYEIVVVNDGSKYDYSSLASKRIRIINHRKNRGYGASLKTGISNSSYSWIGITDADGTYPVEEFPKLIRYVNSYDVVIGKRNRKGIPLIRRFPKAVLRSFASFLANKPIPDLNSGMRIFKKEIAMKFWHLYPEGFSFTSTLTMGCLTNNIDVKFTPINYFKRKGKSHIKPIKDTIRFFSLVLRLTVYFSPLRFFVPMGLTFGILAILRGIRDIYIQNHFGGLCLVLFFLSIQTFFFGLIADLIIKNNKMKKD